MLTAADKYKENPIRTTLEGKQVAIGGDIKVTPTPPKIPFTVKEATQAQYKKLEELGYEIIKTEENAGTKESATKAIKGRKTNK